MRIPDPKVYKIEVDDLPTYYQIVEHGGSVICSSKDRVTAEYVLNCIVHYRNCPDTP